MWSTSGRSDAKPLPRRGRVGRRPPSPRGRLGNAVSATISSAGGGQRRQVAAAVLVGVVLQALIFAFVFPNLWYGVHESTDAPRLQQRATRVWHGELPYRDFDFEYPPLSVPLLLAPGHADGPAELPAYERWFAVEMFVLTLLTSVVITLSAWTIWRRPARTFQAAAAGALFVVVAGPIVENRYDMAVALLVSLTILLLARRRTSGAGAVVGLGTALKTAPLVLLPLVLSVADGRRRRLWAGGAAALVLLVAYLPFVVVAPDGVLESFAYHGDRPLQVESTLATPLLLLHLAGAEEATVRYTFGSHNLHASGAGPAVWAAPLLTVGALAAAWALTWRARRALVMRPQALALAVLAALLAFMVFNKVASPQYYVWLIAPAALLLLEDRLVGILMLATAFTTQVEFPAFYWPLVHLEAAGIVVVTLRNGMLVVTFAMVLARLWRLGSGRE